MSYYDDNIAEYAGLNDAYINEMQKIDDDYKKGIHTMKDGKKIRLADMDNNHLLNAYNLFENSGKGKYFKAELDTRNAWPERKVVELLDYDSIGTEAMETWLVNIYLIQSYPMYEYTGIYMNEELQYYFLCALKHDTTYSDEKQSALSEMQEA